MSGNKETQVDLIKVGLLEVRRFDTNGKVSNLDMTLATQGNRYILFLVSIFEKHSLALEYSVIRYDSMIKFCTQKFPLKDSKFLILRIGE